MKIRPLYDRVVVRRSEEEQTSAGGIVLPGSAKEKPNQGEVLAVGEGKLLENGELRPVGVNVGDRVIFGQYSGNTVKVDGEELIILGESEIFGIIEA
ncbi:MULTISPECIES: co-chaperone GroES [Spongiibacter]|jgi:chaperonin GroES|uniref:co-chaperone GroES n=1 Tax=Spongiibacter TaxID=630749 RepID=UPI0003B4DE3D|nr:MULTISPECIES: co-chaperone GroES [Spongiibacter]MAY38399.1 co-chaperone GroES [Spongiibacter sp.]MBI59085.1 co-chaperone GroES [Spongiibacter sp.]MBO6754393.1 co-chaperone GroES [Spongiibacter sp.]MBU72314.1 co-chaperone GroES [Spongiibacter sp.]|tara:strand:- start:5224 stop:5514 length:291 start_codon:yes stop_codon:yes gene_type:complete